MVKRLFIIHGWGGNPNELLHRCLKKNFSKNGFKVIVPHMPNKDEPLIKEWVSCLNKIVGKADENTYFIGHSIGCQAIMRYLETLPEKTKVGGCIFIAGWFNLDNMETKEEEKIAKPWIKNKIDFNKVKDISQEIKVYLSSNEYYGFIEENVQTFKEKLGAKVIIEDNMGHFTNEEGESKIYKFASKLDF
ncbi:MAG: DUF1749 domain-containing protein [Nanoarchaeota archaeon]|nr:DUF1749 domain-containing protein [Nanoarchaeota archaeon]